MKLSLCAFVVDNLLINSKVLHGLFGVHNSYQGYEVMHMGLMVHNPCKWYEYTPEWVGGAQFQYWGQSYTCDAKLLETLQSYERGGLWCTTHKFGSKLCTWGVVVHNSERRNKVRQVVA